MTTDISSYFEENGRKHPLTIPGSNYVQVQAWSLAGPGEYTDEFLVVVGDRNGAHLVIILPVFGCILLMLIIGLVVYYYYNIIRSSVVTLVLSNSFLSYTSYLMLVYIVLILCLSLLCLVPLSFCSVSICGVI